MMASNLDVEYLDIKESNIFVKLEKFESICRICLSEDIHNSKYLNEMHSPELSLAEMVMLCAQVDIQAEDRLPDAICEPCLRDLQGAHAFRKRCETSDSLLRRLLATREHLALTAATPSDNVITNQLLAQAEDIVKYEDSCSDGHDTSTSHTGITVKTKKVKRKKSKKHSKSVKNSDLELQCNIDNVKLDAKGKVMCDICNKVLANKFSLKHHQYRMHSEERKRRVGDVTGYGKGKLYHCNECPYSSPRRHNLLYHLRTHSGERPFTCEVCGASFTQPGSLTDHRKVHSNTMYYQCDICDKRFKFNNIFKRHRFVHTQPTFPCTICNKLLKSNESLQQHIKRHLNLKEYGCESCGTTFVTKAELLNHKRSHSSDKNYECDICGKLLRDKHGIEWHLLRHTGQKDFHCQVCGFSTFTKGQLKIHSRKHTREKVHSCPVCPVKFIHRASIKDHMFVRHGIKYKLTDHTDRRRVK